MQPGSNERHHLSSGRPLFFNPAWGIVVGVLVMHAVTIAYFSHDLEAMVEIQESSPNFARDELNEEAWSLLDLTSLLQTVVDDAVDGGGDAQLITADEPGAKGACTRGQPVVLRRALQPSVRLEYSRNRDTGGTWLGLSIAASVIKPHQGTLTFLQGPTGFTVSVFLPPASV